MNRHTSSPVRVRLIGWLLVVAGGWSAWKALTGDEPWGGAGILVLILGLGLLSGRACAVARWIGQGMVTGLCLFGGLGILALGASLGLSALDMAGEGAHMPLEPLALPVIFVGTGCLLVAAGIRRLWRLRELP